jgi:LmbE family N-acetylglucosaminyl deacetylase
MQFPPLTQAAASNIQTFEDNFNWLHLSGASMEHPHNGKCVTILLLLALFAARGGTLQAQQVKPSSAEDTYNANNRPPDPRYKADVLVVVAHPDDEVMAAAYIARAIDQKKRVAVIFTTRGDGGVNDYGPEQSAAMGDIRELEGMRAVYSLGVTYAWNLGGPDTPSQNVLESLETCHHGRCLERMVRLVRLIRPDVILTWLPVFVTGENHSDHQAAGVLATEAFDLAGDPLAFPEQVSPAREPKKNMNRTEGLRPWQTQKIYYFSNATHTDFFERQGPQYPATDISPTRHMSYGEIAGEEFSKHLTQGGGKVGRALAAHNMQALEKPIPLMKPTRLVLGKSLVGGEVTDDIFTGIMSAGIGYQRPPGYTPAIRTKPVLELGDPWDYYRKFWQAHGLSRLPGLVPQEVSVPTEDILNIPLLLENPLDTAIDITLGVHAPEGWAVKPVAPAHIDAHTRYFIRVQAKAPAERRSEWQQFTITAESTTGMIGTVPLRVQLTNWALPQ